MPANKNNDEFPSFKFSIKARDKSVWPGKLTEELQDLLVRAKQVVTWHTHVQKKYRHDRTTKDGSIVLPLSLVEEVLRRGRWWNKKAWDLLQVQREFALCQEEGFEKMRLPAQLVVDLLERPKIKFIFDEPVEMKWETIKNTFIAAGEQDHAHMMERVAIRGTNEPKELKPPKSLKYQGFFYERQEPEKTPSKGHSMGALVEKGTCAICDAENASCGHLWTPTTTSGPPTKIWSYADEYGELTQAKLTAFGIPEHLWPYSRRKEAGFDTASPPANVAPTKADFPTTLQKTWDEVYSEKEEEEVTVPGSIKRIAQRHITSSPHSLSKMEWDDEVRTQLREWMWHHLQPNPDGSLKELTTFVDTLKERLQLFIGKGFVNGPLDRFRFYTHATDHEMFITVLDISRVSEGSYWVLAPDGKTKLKLEFANSKWVKIERVSGGYAYLHRKDFFRDGTSTIFGSDTDPFGTIQIKF